jgi:hypothetical protein
MPVLISLAVMALAVAGVVLIVRITRGPADGARKGTWVSIIIGVMTAVLALGARPIERAWDAAFPPPLPDAPAPRPTMIGPVAPTSAPPTTQPALPTRPSTTPPIWPTTTPAPSLSRAQVDLLDEIEPGVFDAESCMEWDSRFVGVAASVECSATPSLAKRIGIASFWYASSLDDAFAALGQRVGQATGYCADGQPHRGRWTGGHVICYPDPDEDIFWIWWSFDAERIMVAIGDDSAADAAEWYRERGYVVR